MVSGLEVEVRGSGTEGDQRDESQGWRETKLDTQICSRGGRMERKEGDGA